MRLTNIKHVLIGLLLMIGVAAGFNAFTTTAHGDIQVSGNTYTVTSGNDLFNLLANTNNYWSNSRQPANNITIKVAKPVTLPGNDQTLYRGLTNVTVDFQNNQFYVGNAASSRVSIPSTSNAQITLANVHNVTNATNNYALNVPNPSGNGTGTYLYASYYGLLFSADWGQSGGVRTCAAQITYHNITYDMPNDLGSGNQPLTSYFVPINFTGTNNINTSVSGQQLGEIPNIKVSSGTTTLSGGSSSAHFSTGMIAPYYNHINNDTFVIDVAQNSTLNLINNDTRTNMIGFVGVNNDVILNNNGTLNFQTGSANTTLFGTNTNSVTLNANASSNTNFQTQGVAFSGSDMNRARFTGNFAKTSQTTFISASATPFYNRNTAWSNSGFNVTAGSKILAYSGGTPAGGLMNSARATIPFTFNGDNTTQGYVTNVVPTTVNDYDNLTAKDSTYNDDGTTVQSNTLTPTADNGLLISAGLSALELGAGNYNWQYSLKDLANTPSFLDRTSGDNLNFKIMDTMKNPSFHISASYTPNEANQPFSMWFADTNQQTQLNNTAQTVLTNQTMTKSNNMYTKNYDKSSGLLIKADNKAKSGTYGGVVDWAVTNGIS